MNSKLVVIIIPCFIMYLLLVGRELLFAVWRADQGVALHFEGLLSVRAGGAGPTAECVHPGRAEQAHHLLQHRRV